MKIIYVENARIPSERAHAYQTVQWCSWMARLGHEVILVTPDRADQQDVFNYYHLPERNFTHILLPTFDALRYSWIPQPLAYLIQRASFVRYLRGWAKSQRADLWYTRSTVMIEALMNTTDSRWVLEVHDDPATRKRRWHKTMNHVGLFVAISEGMKKHLVSQGVDPSRVLVAHDGVDLLSMDQAPQGRIRTQLGIKHDTFLAVYTGSLYPWKGVDFIVENWPADPGLQLLIVGGPDEERERLQVRIQKKISANIHVLPRMPREQIFSLLKEANLGLLPTSPAFAIGRDYTSPLKLFEYLAAGLPILASDVPSSHEVLTSQTARFFRTESNGFVNELLAIFRDRPWRIEAEKQAHVIVKNYTWEARAKRISESLSKAVQPDS